MIALAPLFSALLLFAWRMEPIRRIQVLGMGISLVGVVIFLVSVVTAFTGYLVQQNFDSQWIALNAKDGINSVGIGAWFNVLNYGQMFMFHILLLPLVVGALIVVHVLLVRRRGVVPPFPTASDGRAKSAEAQVTS